MSLGANIMGFLFVTWISQTAVAYMSGYLLAVTAIAAFAFYLSPLSSPASAPSAVKDAMRVGAAILPHSIALLLLAQGAVILLSLLSGPSEAGDYAKVQIFALAPVTLLAALNNVWVTEIMSATAAERGPRLRKIVAKGSFAAFVICVLGSGFAALGTRVIAPGNEDLIPLAQILPLVSFGYFIYLIASSILFVHNRTHWMAALTPAVAFVGFLGAFFPARDGNVFFVGFVVILAYFVLGLTYCIMAVRRGSSEWQVGLYFVLLALAVIFCLAVLAVPNSLLGAYISAFYGVASASVAIAVACRVAKRLS